MLAAGLVVVLTALSSCVLSLPVTPGQLENEDVKVMKCIVETLADVLSGQQHVPVSQDCLETLKTDDRLVTILRRHSFLKELQEIAVQGDQERAQRQRDAETTTPSLQSADEAADRSMLEALGGPGERSILAQARRGEGAEEAEGEVKRMEEESEEKRANSAEDSEEEGSKGGERRDAPRNKSKEKRVHEEEEEEEVKRGSRENPRRWAKRTKALQVKKKEEAQQHEVPHHSKELTEEKEEEEEQKTKKRGASRWSPEEKELQMIAKRPLEERRAMEEEGSASRKSEDPEIESLAAIESELENVAQKLHELRRG